MGKQQASGTVPGAVATGCLHRKPFDGTRSLPLPVPYRCQSKNREETKTTKKEEKIQPSSFFVVFVSSRFLQRVYAFFASILSVIQRAGQARLFNTRNSRRRPCASCSARMASLILCAFSGLCSCA